jgi:hypothetical protein
MSKKFFYSKIGGLKWTPTTTLNPKVSDDDTIVKQFCNATASNPLGEDYFVDYVYEIHYDEKKNKKYRLAYVECDYVE